MTALAVQVDELRSEIEAFKAAPMLDAQRFRYLMDIAEVMANSSMLPEALTHTGTKNDKRRLTDDQIRANAFLVCNFSDRVGMDPFAIAQAVGIVRGKLVLEGRLCAALIEHQLGIRLDYAWEGTGEAMTVIVSGERDGVVKSISGSVKQWKTDTWSPNDYAKRLAFRGSREWSKLYAPSILLGIITPDEAREMELTEASNRAIPTRTGLAGRLTVKNGFNATAIEQTLDEFVDPETGEISEKSAAAEEQIVDNPAAPIESPDPSAETYERVPAGTFVRFGRTLFRATTRESLAKMADAFWKSVPFAPQHPDDIEISANIMGIHYDLLQGEIDRDEATKRLEQTVPS